MSITRSQTDIVRTAMQALEYAEYLAMFTCENTGAGDVRNHEIYGPVEMTGDIETCGCAYAGVFWACRRSRLALSHRLLGNKKRLHSYYISAFGIDDGLPSASTRRRIIKVKTQKDTP